jgi:hypothetical protein
LNIVNKITWGHTNQDQVQWWSLMDTTKSLQKCFEQLLVSQEGPCCMGPVSEVEGHCVTFLSEEKCEGYRFVSCGAMQFGRCHISEENTYQTKQPQTANRDSPHSQRCGGFIRNVNICTGPLPSFCIAAFCTCHLAVQ